MLMNNLDPEVAERPAELVVYGGIGRAARDWDSFDRIVRDPAPAGGRPDICWCNRASRSACSAPMRDAPRVLIANSNLVPHWATWENFHALDRLGLMMYGQMTAGSWIYIGSQGIVQGTYETFVEAGRQHYGGDLSGRWILTAGLGGMGGAQPLAATMAGASCLAVECQSSRIEMRLRTRATSTCRRADLDEALSHDRARLHQRPQAGLRRARWATRSEVFPELFRRGVRPDMVTDQTSAHDPQSTATCRSGWTTAHEWEQSARALNRQAVGASRPSSLDGANR